MDFFHPLGLKNLFEARSSLGPLLKALSVEPRILSALWRLLEAVELGEICSRGCGRGGKNTLPLWACDFCMFLSQVLKVVKCYIFYMSILYVP